MPDARTGQRFTLALPVKIKSGNSQRSHLATTGNLSAAGVFISTDLPFRAGTKVSFKITLPAEATGLPNSVEVSCAGRVVRIEEPRRGKRRGVACVIDRYQFVPKRKREAK